MITTSDVERQSSDAKNMIGRLGILMWTVWKAFWIYQYRALREVYWLMNSDAKVRSQGLQTVGRVNETETRQHRDSEGDTYETHHVTYRFMANGHGHTGEQRGLMGDRWLAFVPIAFMAWGDSVAGLTRGPDSGDEFVRTRDLQLPSRSGR